MLVRGVNLKGANLTGANLVGANFTDDYELGPDDLEINVGGLENLEGANFQGAIWDESTVWPEGFTPPEQ